MGETKRCTKCGVEKPLKEFATRRTGRRAGEATARCLICVTLHSRQWAQRNPEKRRASVRRWYLKNQQRRRNDALRRNYNITLADFNAMLADQGGRCAICRTDNPGKQGWVADHCHVTQRVRGILCPFCNWGLGNFKDDVQILGRASEYLLKGQVDVEAAA